jgi:hypothetical protein
MPALDLHSTNLLATVMLIALLAVAAWLIYRETQSHRLQRHFGSEYHRMVDQVGDRAKAEAELLQRERRVQKLHIVPLSPADAARFDEAWRSLQARFVDSPEQALSEADRLVRELMMKRGYPMGDFDSRAADISVDHPMVVDHYRRGHEIAVRLGRDGVDTEAMRQAVVHYRALFAELLEVTPEPQQPPQARPLNPRQEARR